MSNGFTLKYPGSRINDLLDKINYLTFVEESLIGVIDGNNCIYTTTYNYISDSTQVYINGILQTKNVHYYETDTNEITFSDAPTTTGFDDVLIIKYLRS